MFSNFLKWWSYERIIFRLESERCELLDKVEELEAENKHLQKLVEHKEEIIRKLKEDK